MTKFTVECTNIKWAVEAEDICYRLPENATDEDIEKEIEFVKQDLPDVVRFTLEAENEDEITKDYVLNELSEQTNWLNEGCEYKIVSQEEI